MTSRRMLPKYPAETSNTCPKNQVSKSVKAHDILTCPPQLSTSADLHERLVQRRGACAAGQTERQLQHGGGELGLGQAVVVVLQDVHGRRPHGQVVVVVIAGYAAGTTGARRSGYRPHARRR